MSWFSTLNNGKFSLMNTIPFEELQNGYVICKEFEKTRKYSFFDDLVSMMNYVKNNKNNSFHEVIIDPKSQKFRLDIDIDLSYDNIYEINNENNFIEEILNNLQVTFKTYNKNLTHNDIMIFQSHGKLKRSFHIVIKRFFVNDHIQAKELFNIFMNNFKSFSNLKNYSHYIDNAVYKSTQNFRLINSKKFGSNRYKTLIKEFKWKNKIINNENDEFTIFKNSLLTYIDESEYLPVDVKMKQYENNDITIDVYNQIIKIFNENYEFKNFFKPEEAKGCFIPLNRLDSSYCCVCKRPHENENAFLVLIGDSIFFDCRRSNGIKILIGKIKNSPENINQILSYSKNEQYIEDLPIFYMGKLGIKKGNEEKGYNITRNENMNIQLPKKIIKEKKKIINPSIKNHFKIMKR